MHPPSFIIHVYCSCAMKLVELGKAWQDAYKCKIAKRASAAKKIRCPHKNNNFEKWLTIMTLISLHINFITYVYIEFPIIRHKHIRKSLLLTVCLMEVGRTKKLSMVGPSFTSFGIVGKTSVRSQTLAQCTGEKCIKHWVTAPRQSWCFPFPLSSYILPAVIAFWLPPPAVGKHRTSGQPSANNCKHKRKAGTGSLPIRTFLGTSR
jgi:hypothetical protein